MAAIPPVCEFGWQAPDFTLPATDGKSYSLEDIAGPNGVVVAFIWGLLKKARSTDSIGMSTSCGGWHDRQSDPRPVGVLCLRIAA